MINFKPITVIKISLVFGVFFFCFMVFKFVLSSVAYSQYTQINHFSNIELCSNLDDYIIEDKPLVDSYVKENEYISSYNYALCYNDIKFEMYAYEFKSAQVAKEYYCRIENDTVDGDIDYSGNSNLFSSKLIVRYGTNVYRLKTGNTDKYLNIMKLLNSIFDINIRK